MTPAKVLSTVSVRLRGARVVPKVTVPKPVSASMDCPPGEAAMPEISKAAPLSTSTLVLELREPVEEKLIVPALIVVEPV
jgi:hypothetical protein